MLFRSSLSDRFGRRQVAFHQHGRQREHVTDVVETVADVVGGEIPSLTKVADGYSKEEWKMMVETRKIMGLPKLKITATTVRVPTVGGHSESINASFEKPITVNEVREILGNAPGVTLQDNPETFEYPMPLNSHNKDDVFVGRIRQDESEINAINLWVVSDNLRKGAATNAIQIAELLIQNGRITA